MGLGMIWLDILWRINSMPNVLSVDGDEARGLLESGTAMKLEVNSARTSSGKSRLSLLCRVLWFLFQLPAPLWTKDEMMSG